jgi:hypothetical protein
MFVRYESGLCPHCFNGQRAKHTESVVREVLLELEEFDTDDADEAAPN